MSATTTADAPEVPSQLTSLAPCITCGCNSVYTYKVCSSCYLIFSCCSMKCYKNPLTHRLHTQHYRTCRQINRTPLQIHVHDSTLNPDRYQFCLMSLLCRYCGRVDYDEENSKEKPKESIDCCQHGCGTRYCTRECQEKDRERHLTTEGECIKMITNQLPPQTRAPSVGSSILLPDLLAHTISFLSLYQWSIAARVNHAWRNATLHPSAFPKAHFTLGTTSSPLGPLHRVCVRSLESTFQADVLPWNEYPHLRSVYATFYDDGKSIGDTDCLKKMMECLPSAMSLIRLHINKASISLSPLTLTRFARLNQLLIEIQSERHELQLLSQALQHLTELHVFSLTIFERGVSASALNEQNKSLVQLEKDRTDRASTIAILDTIESHVLFLSTLKLILPPDLKVSSLFSKPIPQVTQLVLKESYSLETVEADICALGQLSQHLPKVNNISFQIMIAGRILYDPSYSDRNDLLLDSLISCINGFGVELRVLDLRIQSVYSPNDSPDWPQSDNLPIDQIEKMLTECHELKEFHLSNNDSFLKKEEIDILTQKTPKLVKLSVEVKSLSPIDASTLIESLHVRFTHLTSLNIFSNSRLLFAPPTTEFISRQDSLPPLRSVWLQAFDPNQVAGILRLLPKVDSLTLTAMHLSPDRFFEYAQYRPLVLLKQRYSVELETIMIQTFDEGDMKWFEGESSLVHMESTRDALPPHVQPFYDRGVALSQQVDSDAIMSEASSSHRWMFSRVCVWNWLWCSIEMPPPVAAEEDAKIENAGEETEEEYGDDGSDEENRDWLFSHLPEAFAYHRSSVWVYTHAADIYRNDEYYSIASRLQNFALERHPKD